MPLTPDEEYDCWLDELQNLAETDEPEYEDEVILGFSKSIEEEVGENMPLRFDQRPPKSSEGRPLPLSPISLSKPSHGRTAPLRDGFVLGFGFGLFMAALIIELVLIFT